MSFADELGAAFLKVDATALQRDVLRELARKPQGALELAARLGLRHYVLVNAAIGSLGRAVRRLVSRHPDGLVDGEYQWWHVLATGERSGKGWVWTLRSEVVVAASNAAWLDESEFRLPEEIGAAGTGVEGAVQTVTVNRYERDRELRAACIRHYGARCFVCGTDMGEVYGEYAHGLIHVHHLAPLADAMGATTVDAVRDLRPLCPN